MAQITADSERTAPVAAAVANPAPLGLSAFALTTFVLSASNAGFIFPHAAIPSDGFIVVGLAIFYGGLIQLLAGLQEFKAGNTFGATAFCSYGGFWLAFGLVLLPPTGIAVGLGKDLFTAVGVFLLGWTIFTGMMFLGTLRSNLALIAVFGLLFLTFLALTIGFLNAPGSTGITWIQIGGWLGIVTALVAWYTALAGVLASSKSVFQLPVFPIG
ncbi:MAG: acetate uptake transporter [Ktedonobacteraceae bacterium]